LKQTAIGWRHLFLGHLSTEWGTKQDYYVCRQKINTLTHTGAGWSLQTLTILWSKFLTLWKARNEAIHGHNLVSQQQTRKAAFDLKWNYCTHSWTKSLRFSGRHSGRDDSVPRHFYGHAYPKLAPCMETLYTLQRQICKRSIHPGSTNYVHVLHAYQQHSSSSDQ
jgi:hypothetical protein